EQGPAADVAIVDAGGCVVAATQTERGACLDDLPEVQAALRGEYSALTREPEQAWPFSPERLKDYRSVRVFVALPVSLGGRAAGAVRMSARSSGPLEAFWEHRRTVGLAALLCVIFMVGVTHFFSRMISRPVQAVTAAADAVAHGETPPALTPRRNVP